MVLFDMPYRFFHEALAGFDRVSDLGIRSIAVTLEFGLACKEQYHR